MTGALTKYVLISMNVQTSIVHENIGCTHVAIRKKKSTHEKQWILCHYKPGT
jgi:hypothetical protein